MKTYLTFCVHVDTRQIFMGEKSVSGKSCRVKLKIHVMFEALSSKC